MTYGSLSTIGCGKTKNCWFQPSGCEKLGAEEHCNSSVKWFVMADGVQFELEAIITDLEPNNAYWIAIGISKDIWMGDDSVMECVISADGKGQSFISFNDETNNKQLLQKQMHSVNDGEQFPWITEQLVSFCRYNCTDEKFIIAEMKQSNVSRYWRYRFAVIHGIFSLFAWFVLGSSAILLARFFKPLWPRKKLLGTAVWFQLHRDFWIFSILLQILAVFLIIYQAGRLYECSYECTSDDWSKKMHVITGIAATALALFQPMLALLRPGPNHKFRPIFNWLHWFIGMTAWSFAITTIVLSVPMGKTGLQRVFGHTPTWIIASYIIFFLLICVVLEFLAATSERRIDKIGMILMNFLFKIIGMTKLNLWLKKMVKFATVRICIFVVHMAVAIAVSLIISIMLLYILWSHSP
ncbi:unnamed protein product [Dracunculus medinensis]|uniref:Cytochrome b561 domain-containing protein n=1 Tax=Dracunculus medinensis TaxID=318479 RepID=A0A3P7Q9A6_DRAME|nr:unnamed protein product [Dracunculus medinensis]